MSYRPQCSHGPRWFQDVRNVSSGTLAGLIGRSDYATIDAVHAAFVRHGLGVASASPNAFTSWQHAWEYFRRTGDYQRALAAPKGNA